MEKEDRYKLESWDVLENENILNLFKNTYKILKRQNTKLLIDSFIPFILAVLLILSFNMVDSSGSLVFRDVKAIDIFNFVLTAAMFSVSWTNYSGRRYRKVSTNGFKLKYKEGTIKNIIGSGGTIKVDIEVGGVTVNFVDISMDIKEEIELGDKVYVIASDRGNLTMSMTLKAFDNLITNQYKNDGKLTIKDKRS